MGTRAPSRPADHLLNVYLKWKEKPSAYEKEIVSVIEGVARKAISTFGYRPVYWRIEDEQDLIQDLKLAGFRCLSKIKEPDNKRIYNYLKVSFQRVLIKRAYKLARRIDTEEAENRLAPYTVVDEFSYIADPTLKLIAQMLSRNEDRKSVSAALQISPIELAEHIDKLKEFFPEENGTKHRHCLN